MQIIISAIFNFICLLGIGSLTNNLFKYTSLTFYQSIFLKISFGIFLSAIFTTLSNFFFPININLANIFTILSFFFGLYFVLKDKKNKEYFLILCVVGILSFLLIYKSSNVLDFGLYHGSYLSILNNEKIIFGIANIHFRFGHSSILQETQAIFNNFLFYPNNFQTLILVFYVAFIFFVGENLFNKNYLIKNRELYFFCLFLLILICTKIYRFNDLGNDLMPNLINFYIWIECIKLFLNKDLYSKKMITNYFKILLTLYLFCVFLKIQFILSIVPIIFIYFFLNKKIIFKKILNYSMIFLVPITVLFLTKNFINSGCLIYPIEKLCFKEIEWSTNNELSKLKPNIISVQSEAWSKGWPQRIKNDISYKDFLENFNWINPWLSVHFKVILKKISIPFFIILMIIIYINVLNSNKIGPNKKIIYFLLISLIPLVFWFLKIPLYRYGYSTIYIFSFLFFITFINISKNDINKFFKVSKKIIFLFLFILISLNITRILSSDNNDQWPKIYKKKVNENIIYELPKYNLIIYKDPCFYTSKICTSYLLNKKLKIKRNSGYLFFYF